MFENTLIIILVPVGVVLLLFTVLGIILHNKNKKYVMSKSNKFSNLKELNSRTNFYKVPKNYTAMLNLQSKYKYDTMDLEKTTLNQMMSNPDFYNEKITKYNENKDFYDIYCTKYRTILNSNDNYEYVDNMALEKFQKIEEKLLERNKLDMPNTQMELTLEVEYVTPKGRTHYKRWITFNHREIEEIYQEALDANEYKKTKAYRTKKERGKMSRALRFDVLKRDGYRCKICGISEEDGARLHVDHIVPVAKNGKTTMDNLQTLCDSCNLGKSDKYL